MKVFFCRSLVICLDWSSSFWSVKLVRTNRIESGIRREFMVLGLLKVFTISFTFATLGNRLLVGGNYSKRQ